MTTKPTTEARPKSTPPAGGLSARSGAPGKDVNSRDYNAAIGSVVLTDIKLVDMTFQVMSKYWNSNAERKFSYGIELERFNFSTEDGDALGVFACNVSAAIEEELALHAMAKYLIVYSGLSGHTENTAKTLLDGVGRIAVYPYFRSLVATLSWNSGANLPPLPVLKHGV